MWERTIRHKIFKSTVIIFKHQIQKLTMIGNISYCIYKLKGSWLKPLPYINISLTDRTSIKIFSYHYNSFYPIFKYENMISKGLFEKLKVELFFLTFPYKICFPLYIYIIMLFLFLLFLIDFLYTIVWYLQVPNHVLQIFNTNQVK